MQPEQSANDALASMKAQIMGSGGDPLVGTQTTPIPPAQTSTSGTGPMDINTLISSGGGAPLPPMNPVPMTPAPTAPVAAGGGGAIKALAIILGMAIVGYGGYVVVSTMFPLETQSVLQSLGIGSGDNVSTDTTDTLDTGGATTGDIIPVLTGDIQTPLADSIDAASGTALIIDEKQPAEITSTRDSISSGSISGDTRTQPDPLAGVAGGLDRESLTTRLATILSGSQTLLSQATADSDSKKRAIALAVYKSAKELESQLGQGSGDDSIGPELDRLNSLLATMSTHVATGSTIDQSTIVTGSITPDTAMTGTIVQ